MKADQIKDEMLVETGDAGLKRCNPKDSQKGIIFNPEIKKEGTLSKVLVLFDKETKPRYVPISRLKARES